MINLAVISLKDIINFVKRIIIGIIIMCFIFKIIGNIKNGNYVRIEDLKEKSFFDYCKIIDDTLVISNYYNNNEKIINESGIKKILVSELSILDAEEELMEKENQEELVEFEESVTQNNSDNENINQIEPEESKTEETKAEPESLNEVSKTLPTTVINENNKTDTYTDIYKTVKIKNESKYQLTEDIVTPDFNLSYT